MARIALVMDCTSFKAAFHLDGFDKRFAKVSF